MPNSSFVKKKRGLEKKVYYLNAWEEMRSNSCEIEDGTTGYAGRSSRQPTVGLYHSQCSGSLRASLFLQVCRVEMGLPQGD